MKYEKPEMVILNLQMENDVITASSGEYIEGQTVVPKLEAPEY